jgi:uncharacterized protein
MRLTEIAFGSAQPIAGYGPGFFRIGTTLMQGATLVTPWNARPWGGLADTESPLALAGRIDVLLLGTGATMAPVPAAFRTLLETAGIGVEPMGSPAACRTYNVLLGEGRRIAAALLPV